MMLSEVIKQILLTVVIGNGKYQFWYFPFQICSMPMYICLIAGATKSEKLYRACLAFLSTFGLLAGAAAFLDTSGMYYELRILTVHSFLWHIAMIIIGGYAWKIRGKGCAGEKEAGESEHASEEYEWKIRGEGCAEEKEAGGTEHDMERGRCGSKCGKYEKGAQTRDFCASAAIYLAGCMIAEIINISFYNLGWTPVNMFYISPKYYMAQVFAANLVPVLGNNAVIVLYILTTIAAAGAMEFFGRKAKRFF